MVAQRSALLLSTLALGASALLATATSAKAIDDSQPIDFGRDIKPLLSNNCFACHGPDPEHREADLRLDTFEGATELHDGIAAVVPGDESASELIGRIDDARRPMPPEDSGLSLTPEERDLLRRWIASGAEYNEHWSFVFPERATTETELHQIDSIVQTRLSEEGLAMSPEADRYALARRLSLDLVGLPPDPVRVETFLQDERADAYEVYVDELLASPHYGEHWAALWLDLARYADSKGYGSDPLRTIWAWRDWVIDAYDQNMPFDRFTELQMAGDLLPEATEAMRLATAFHRNTMVNTEGGTDNEEFRVAAIKDRANTTGQVWLGLTMGCAECHTHKFDPITHHEYYSFFGIFNQTADRDGDDDSPRMETIPRSQLARRAVLEQELEALDLELESNRAAQDDATQGLMGRTIRIEIPGKKQFLSLAEVEVFVAGENIAPAGTATQSSLYHEGRAGVALDGNKNGNYNLGSVTHTLDDLGPWWELDLGSMQPLDRILVWNRTDGSVGARLLGAVVQVLDEDRQVLWETEMTEVPAITLYSLNGEAENLVQQRRQRLDLVANLEGFGRVQTPILVALEEDQQRSTHVLLKGNFLLKGDEVQAGVPAHFSESASVNNRLELAHWLTSPDNPLTARVQVNRLWARIFGMGLVETEEDFGNQGTRPSNSELLDWLALEYMDSGWDQKHILRRIVTSATYRQSSHVGQAQFDRDPDNRLLARGPRRRLSAEQVRDSALAVAGLLSPKKFGPSVFPPQPAGLWAAAFNGADRTWETSMGEDRYRRGLYTFMRRSSPYPSLQVFDAPTRETCTIRRIRTNTALQAFVTLNDPVFVECAQALGRRMLREVDGDDAARAAYGLQLATQRPPQPAEIAAIVALVEENRAHYADQLEEARLLCSDPLGPLADSEDPVEFAAWTVAGNVLLNLDEVLTKH
ncbi:MAG: hypothetical protein ACI8QS_001901 [Planctomycetota bacterium]|jgi:hypothetical protein